MKELEEILKKFSNHHLINSAIDKSWTKFTTSSNNNIKKQNEQQNKSLNNNSQLLKKSLSPNKKEISRVLTYLLAIFTFLQFLIIILVSIVTFYAVLILHKPTQGLILRHTQEYIYPFMRQLRLIIIPFIISYPQITNYYEESCLLPNPYFVTQGSCSSCESVKSVMNLTLFPNITKEYYRTGLPFVINDSRIKEFNIETFVSIYENNKGLFSTVPISTNSKNLPIKTFDHFLNLYKNNPLIRISLKINRVSLMRLLRLFFPPPSFVPRETEISIQHFLFFDQVSAPTYELPITEFANVFIVQAAGSRHIVLIPTEHCIKNCKRISVLLHPCDTLFYNWLHWNPISVPYESSNEKNKNQPTISYLGSFY